MESGGPLRNDVFDEAQEAALALMESDSVALFLRSEDFESYLDEMVAKKKLQLEAESPTKRACGGNS